MAELDFNSLHAEIQEYESQIAVIKNKYQDLIKNKLTDILKLYFDEDTECKSIVWKQYTPFFNDGSECVFSVHDPAFYSYDVNNMTAEQESDHDDWDGELLYVSSYSTKDDIWENGKPRPATEAELTRTKLASLITNDTVSKMLKLSFGDHTKVTVTRDGITSEDYDHD